MFPGYRELLISISLLPLSLACSYECNEELERVCLTNIHDFVAPNCFGFLGCVSKMAPCAGQCLPENPVLSIDGTKCSKCEEDGTTCPSCKEDQVWCREEKICKAKTDPCGGKCLSIHYPVLGKNGKKCHSCGREENWCAEENKCHNLETEPCNGVCLKLWDAFYYCEETKKCEKWGSCGQTTTTTVPTPINIPQKASPKPKVSRKEPQKHSPQQHIRNDLLCKQPAVNAIVEVQQGETHVFRGDKFWQLNGYNYAKGPREISNHWKGLEGKIDAALSYDQDILFFKGSQYWKFNQKKLVAGYPKNITAWNGVPSNLDAALNWGNNGNYYFFKGSEYWKYNDQLRGVELGYPKKISEHWKNIPNMVDAALGWKDGSVFFFKNKKFWKTNNAVNVAAQEAHQMDIRTSWFSCNVPS